jgi:hypothetical protein
LYSIHAEAITNPQPSDNKGRLQCIEVNPTKLPERTIFPFFVFKLGHFFGNAFFSKQYSENEEKQRLVGLVLGLPIFLHLIFMGSFNNLYLTDFRVTLNFFWINVCSTKKFINHYTASNLRSMAHNNAIKRYYDKR